MPRAKPNNDALATRLHEEGRKITASVTVQRSIHDVFEAWSDFSTLPCVATPLQSVKRSSATRARCRATGSAGKVEWDVEIIRDDPDHVLAWRTGPDAPVVSAGAISLRELPYCRGTEVKVAIDYLPPQGAAAEAVKTTLGSDPENLVRLSLLRFRQLMEAGEIATTQGQPSGRDGGLDRAGARDEQRAGKDTGT